MKFCSNCSTSKPEKDFAIKRTKKDGTIQHNSICKLCHNTKAQAKYKSAPE